ncbi:MAG TPA: hypothetical protein VGJ46_02030 [Candidatus Limnocylindrales bacterium]
MRADTDGRPYNGIVICGVVAPMARRIVVPVLGERMPVGVWVAAFGPVGD